jgi:hypothetical protein
MTKYFKILLILTLGFTSVKSQTLEEYINRVDLKLRKDQSYLNLNYILFETDPEQDAVIKELPRIYRETYQLKFDDAYTYKLVFLKDGMGMDNIYLLYLDEIKQNTAGDDRLFAAVDDLRNDTSKALNFEDMYTLKYDYPEKYAHLNYILENYLREVDDSDIPSLLGISPDDEVKAELGTSSRDNSDYLNFVKVNSPHWYPKEENNTVFSRRKTSEESPIRLDISFERISFSHEAMDLIFGGSSIEANVNDEVLNLLPWQTSTVSAGIRTLITFSEKNIKPQDATYIDLKFMARFNYDSSNFFDKLVFLSGDEPLLNLHNGIILGATLTRPFSLPFINFHLAFGNKKFDHLNYKIPRPGLPYDVSYHSFTQASGSMSFFWNTSDRSTNRLRIDLGFGYYDIYKAYSDKNTGSFLSSESIKAKFYPDLKLYYNFVPDNSPVLGAMFRFFDGQASVNGWIKIIEFASGHSIRLEAKFISSPLTRSRNEWETKGGSMYQLRYRYGL